jgi:integrase/recombinase XerD
LAPLERLAVPAELSGTRGANRAPGFAYVRATHDLDAVRAYPTTLEDHWPSPAVSAQR